MSAPFVTSVRVEKSAGPHEYVSVWIRGASVGTLCVGHGDGELLQALLMPHGMTVRGATDAEHARALIHGTKGQP